MRTYFELINHLHDLADGDENVNTITTGNRKDVGNYKKEIYPLINFYVVESTISFNNTAVTQYLVEVSALNIRDINKEQVVDKFYQNDNRHDNWNLTRAILKFFTNKLVKTNTHEISLLSAGAAEKIDGLQYSNILDGWTQDLIIEVADRYTSVC